ncbi:MAG TPA: class III lanthipeptide [Candidatus Angelobacter sp.]
MQTILDLQKLEVPVDSSPVGVISLTSSSSDCCKPAQQTT